MTVHVDRRRGITCRSEGKAELRRENSEIVTRFLESEPGVGVGVGCRFPAPKTGLRFRCFHDAVPHFPSLRHVMPRQADQLGLSPVLLNRVFSHSQGRGVSTTTWLQLG